MSKHNVKIWCADKGKPDWRTECSGCDFTGQDYGAPGLAEKAAEKYHNRNETRIDSVKVD